MKRQPIAQVTGTLVGLFFMVAPAIWSYAEANIGDAQRTIGPLAVAFSFSAFWDATRPLRWVNLPLGFAGVIVTLIWGDVSSASVVIGILGSLALIVTSPLGGTMSNRLGKGWRGVAEA